MNKKTATIIGDTSSFHLGSMTNYSEFRKLVDSKYEIVQEIPYNAFSLDFQDYSSFEHKLEKSRWVKGIKKSDVLIVHGEGLTERCEPYVFPLLYFSRIAKTMGSQSQLVNFSMYDVKPFLPFLKEFDYLAPREVVTKCLLENYGLKCALSFDCCILSKADMNLQESDGTVVAIRGRVPFSPQKI